MSVEFVEIIDEDRNILKRTAVGDKSWCFMYNPETKCQSATWLHTEKDANSDSENAKIVGKNNVDCIFYAKGIIHHGFVHEKQNVHS
jgi:hypothetical protein